MNLENIQTLTHATERDIDLLLVEEFKCNNRFSKKFIALLEDYLKVKITFDNINVVHSKRRTYGRREIDICLELKSCNSMSYILIENKLDTTEQANQAESYKDECRLLLNEKDSEAAIAVLICPEKYKEENPEFTRKFDTFVTYEIISKILKDLSQETNDTENLLRLEYRSELIKQAIDKQRRGYTAITRAEIADFNKKYIEKCQKLFPKLKLSASILKGKTPSESKTMIFDFSVLTKKPYLPQTRIVHQLREGNSNINFYTWGNYFEEIASVIKKDLINTPFLVSATHNRRKGGNSGLMIYTNTPSIDNLDEFEKQEHDIIKGITSTELLREWFENNQEIIKKWANLITSIEKIKIT